MTKWDSEREQILEKLWREGHSATQIAKALGDVTRNAVIGKVHRLGLTNKKGTSTVKPSLAEPSKRATSLGEKPISRGKISVVERRRRTDNTPFRTSLDKSITAEVESLNEEVRQAVASGRAKKLGIMELTENTCRWPIGDPATEDFWFCGQPVHKKDNQRLSYCHAHYRVAHRQPNEVSQFKKNTSS